MALVGQDGSGAAGGRARSLRRARMVVRQTALSEQSGPQVCGAD